VSSSIIACQLVLTSLVGVANDYLLDNPKANYRRLEVIEGGRIRECDYDCTKCDQPWDFSGYEYVHQYLELGCVMKVIS